MDELINNLNSIYTLFNLYDIPVIELIKTYTKGITDDDFKHTIVLKDSSDNLIVKGYSDKDDNCFIELYDKDHNIIFKNKFIIWDNNLQENTDSFTGDSFVTVSQCQDMITKIANNISIQNIKDMMAPEIIYRNCIDIYLSSISYKQKVVQNTIKEQLAK